jgi:hypothetical protein
LNNFKSFFENSKKELKKSLSDLESELYSEKRHRQILEDQISQFSSNFPISASFQSQLLQKQEDIEILVQVCQKNVIEIENTAEIQN